MKKIVTCYIPQLLDNNYVVNTMNILRENGFEILSIKKTFSNPLTFFSCQVYNFNWFENANSVKSYYKKLLVISWIKLWRKKIIYTLHNKQPHNIEDNKLSLSLMKKMCKSADVIIGLCPDTEFVIQELYPPALENLEIVSHPNYIGNYDLSIKTNWRDKYGFKNNDLVFLFIGSISPYKNIELLLDIFKNNPNQKIKLLIAGNCCNENYKEKLESEMKNLTNVVYDFRYIPDKEIMYFSNTADIVCLPYHKTSSLNSGAVYLSFSLKKTVICPDIGTINGLEDKSFVYSYSYDSNEEHAKKFKNCVEQVCKDFEENSESLKEKGEKAYQYMLENHSDERISSMYKKIYIELLGKKSNSKYAF